MAAWEQCLKRGFMESSRIHILMRRARMFILGLWVFPLQWGREHKERRRQKASALVWLLLFFSPGAS